ncbi:hypothetical protein BF93_16490 [Brachybacterium phenoliresistens]|uniref:D-inositol 3-phosphate glycosyltransferase n=1 Tax=Brachybacterium phenoliresistens TaxID=396014 RepID=Z9JSQ9_9MICO|nr:heparinase II/III family protein [Brachybacterium phenoliresistens]EWS81415.1 hypothetical protein BF93_16490 [Brachybacterium phenoliresistens]
MRQNVRTAILAGGAGWALAVILLALAAATGQPLLAAAAGILGIVLVIGTCIVAHRVIDQAVTSTYRLATRAKNLEERERSLADRASVLEAAERALEERAAALEDGAGALERRADGLEGSLREHGDRLEGIDAALASARTELARTGGVVSRIDGAVGDLAERHRATATGVAGLTEQVVALEESSRTLSGGVQNLRTAHARGKERLESVRKDVRVLRERVPAGFLQEVETEVAQLSGTSREITRASFESALMLGRTPTAVISPELAARLFDDYLSHGDFLRTRPLLEHFDLLSGQSLTNLRAIYRAFRAAGYWDLAARVVAEVARKSRRENDARAVDKIEHEIELFAHPTTVSPDLPEGDPHDPQGPILHVVGRVLPDTQTGYTLRTQYTALAQARKGLPVAIVGQAGITEHEVEQIEHYVHQGVDYYLLPGKPRKDLLLDEWLAENMVQLAHLVQQVRPSVLHAQSDFFNALIAHAVGARYGIPTVYESRGFWEESWLSRTITSQGWGQEAESLFSMYGLPAAYTLRRHAEEVVRELADHVFTLAEVMRDHILESARGAIEPSAVSIVPNSVEPSSFPVQEPDQELKAQIGLPPDAVVVGYISSIVEYEGIDTLLDAYHLASNVSDAPMCLLIVGDGDYLPTLKKHAEAQKMQGVHFTGRVPHEEVLRYYGLIDLFVVPRKPAAVADLVTPLKPFEAFSTGRAVILSDVGALQEIARQSQAVETFTAGSADDLSRKLLALVEDPARRADLSARAAAWVRNHRTWDSNVSEYYRVYRSLGYAGPASEALAAELRLRERAVNAGDVIDALRDVETAPLTGWFSLDRMKQSGQDILEHGWVFEEFEPIRVAESPDWASYGHRHRTWGFNLHTWKFLEPLLREHTESGDRRWLEASLDIALDWLATYLGDEPPEDPMAWYDMSLALRAPMLLNLLIRVSRHDDLRPQAAILVDGLLRHMEELHRDEAFNPKNNHGFYTAASQLHLARFGAPVPGAARTGEVGMDRMRIMAERQFAADGVHLEHSPDYHRMLLGSFERAIQDGLIEDEEIRERIRRAAHVLGWMVQPDGRLVQLGDTPATVMTTKGATSLDPQTEFILSDGARGQAPTQELAVFHDGGYAFVRSPAPRGPGELGTSGYLAFSAAFHSRAHKHADDLNVVWYDRGAEILVDAGRYGYGDLLPADSPLRKQGFYYGSPERQYVEGTRAHNTLMMDGADQERRSREPYGSAILDATQDGEVFDLSARVHHADYIHRRRVVFTPGRELRVLDAVFSQAPETREAVIWFNVAGDFELVQSEETLVLERPSEEGPLRLEITGPGRLLEPVRGATDPLRGWRSRQDRSLEPVWSIGFAVPVETRAAVSTILRLS